MPRITLPVLDPYASIERPVAMSIAKSIVALINQDDNIIISFPGHAEKQPLFGSRGAQNKDKDAISVESTSKLGVSVREEFEEYDMLSTTVHTRNNRYLFEDPALGIHIAPVYLTTTGVMTLTYRCEDRKEAQAFYDSLRTKISENRTELTLQAKYTYSLPMEFLRILEKCHELRENKGGYGDTFAKWFADHNSKKNTYITNSNGSQLIQAYRETQENITGYFDFSTPPQPEKGDNGATVMIEMDFKYTYQKPSRMAMRWSPIIHNQILPKEYIGDTQDKSYDKMEGDMSYFSSLYENFRSTQQYPQGAFIGVKVPHYDEWVNVGEHPDTHNIITVLLGINETGIPDPIDMNLLPDYDLDPHVVEYMKANPGKITKYGMSPFLITVYEGDYRLPENLVSLDSDFKLSILGECDVRKEYRVQITLLANLTVIAQRYINDLRQWPDICTMVFKALLFRQDINVRYLAGKVFPSKEFWELTRQAHHTPSPYKNKVTQLARLVGIFIIDTRR